jgi:hypothetical protein
VGAERSEAGREDEAGEGQGAGDHERKAGEVRRSDGEGRGADEQRAPGGQSSSRFTRRSS